MGRSISPNCLKPLRLRLAFRIMAFVLCFVGGFSLSVASFLRHRAAGKHPSFSLRQRWEFSMDRIPLAPQPQLAPLPFAPTPGGPVSFFGPPDSAPRPSASTKSRLKGFSHLAPPPKSSKRNEKGKAAGIALIAVAGLLQVVVVVFLFAKRRQMLKVVRTYEYDPTTENCNGASST